MFRQSPSLPPLGPQLRAARTSLGLSIEAAAANARLPQDCLFALEADEFPVAEATEAEGQAEKLGGVEDPGYCRLIAAAYARSMALPLTQIRRSLPPPASLHPLGRTFLTNYALLHRPPRRPLRVVLAPALRSLAPIIMILLLLSAWNMVRHLGRVSWSNRFSSSLRSTFPASLGNEIQ